MLEERGEPLRVRKVIGELPEAIPFLTVDEVNPGSDLAEPRRMEAFLERFHRNGLNILDSLHAIAYSTVMSIAVLEHYSNASLRSRPAARAAARW